MKYRVLSAFWPTVILVFTAYFLWGCSEADLTDTAPTPADAELTDTTDTPDPMDSIAPSPSAALLSCAQLFDEIQALIPETQPTQFNNAWYKYILNISPPLKNTDDYTHEAMDAAWTPCELDGRYVLNNVTDHRGASFTFAYTTLLHLEEIFRAPDQILFRAIMTSGDNSILQAGHIVVFTNVAPSTGVGQTNNAIYVDQNGLTRLTMEILHDGSGKFDGFAFYTRYSHSLLGHVTFLK